MLELALERQVVVPLLRVFLDGLGERLGDGLGVVDGAAEAHCAVQGLGVGGNAVDVVDNQHAAEAGGVLGHGLAVVDEALPAADDLADVGWFQRACVDPIVALHEDALAQRVLLNGEHHDLVVGEQLLLHRLAELDLVCGGAVDGLVVHGGDGVVVLSALALGALAVDARGRGHVEALLGAHVLVVVDLHEVRRLGDVNARQGVSGGAMRLVAYDELEVWNAERLSLVNDVDGLVGGEDGHEPVGIGTATRRVGAPQALGVGGRGVLEVHEGHGERVLAAGGFGVRAHHERGERDARLRHPLAHGLADKGDRGGAEEEGAGAALHPVLREAKRHQRLARAARHDRLAAVMVGERRLYGGDRLLLMWSRVKRYPFGAIPPPSMNGVQSMLDAAILAVSTNMHDPPSSCFARLAPGPAAEVITMSSSTPGCMSA